jgi:hypothetical protein
LGWLCFASATDDLSTNSHFTYSVIALIAEYHRQPEQRRAIVEGLRKALSPAAQPEEVASTEPVPYSPRASFSVGQRLLHATFGNVVVTAAGPTWIEVRLDDGSQKRSRRSRPVARETIRWMATGPDLRT